MNKHSGLALRGAAAIVVLVLPVSGVIWRYIDGASAVSFLYGSGVGMACFASIAVTVSFLTVRPTGTRMVHGLAVYTGRLVFAAVAVGGAVYYDLWPVLPMLCGFIGVYVLENVFLLMMAPTTMRRSRTGGEAARGTSERRMEV